ncbi:PP2C family protein-serine/threonine phosphatase [Zhihengliuella halotolerans]|uniref:Protein phosphatase n=1 Tax=Zhihengliuella halotolerans TaxID=370736 RepID=A0A4V2G9W8_9MICC|nr:protein phosphatase 2C domain-containing protein [Zhihengliuella halotolerans]RZU62016.1 protein phosphatase [Zhihengliuella halotolerans]
MSAGSPETTVTIKRGQATDRGLRRELNEDAFLATDSLFAVADGMGGHEAGEVASRVCVETLAEGYEQAGGQLNAEQIQQLMRTADNAIRAAAAERAGTTLTGAAVVYQEGTPYWLVFNVGDSRTYRLAGGELEQVTVDHSEVQLMMDRGEISAKEAVWHPRRHVITRALGTGDDSRADFWLLPINHGDRLLICSDGLSGELRDETMKEIIDRFAEPQEAVDALVQAALRTGGRDNITVIVADAVSGHIDDDMADTMPRPDAADEGETEPVAAAGRDTTEERKP